jgi:hypothetical protein
MKNFKVIAAAIPSPAVLFVSQWLGLFARTSLTNPTWQNDAENTALGIGAFVALMISILLKDWSNDDLRRYALRFFWATLAAFALCAAISFFSGFGFATLVPDPLLQGIWGFVFVASMVLMIVTVSLGAMSLRDDRPVLFWVLVALCALALLGLGGYLIWTWWRS